MWQELFNWIWLALLVTIIAVRKAHEFRSGKRLILSGTPLLEAALMVLWGAAASLVPVIYMFSTWLDFADLPLEVPPVLGAFGIVLFSIAIWLLHRSHSDLGKHWSPSVEPEEKSQSLVVNGVYQRIRHPMYAAHVLWGVAQALAFPNLIAGPTALALILLLLALRIPREERAMLEEFGDIYRHYMSRTGRLLPKLHI